MKKSLYTPFLCLLWIVIFVFNNRNIEAKISISENYLNYENVMSDGKDYTFCWGSISVTLKDGGVAIMNRYSVDGQLIKSISGEWTAYGSPGQQTIKIKYEVSDEVFSYTLISNSFGPSVLIDGEGRNYNVCNIRKDNNLSNTNDSYDQVFVGSYSFPDRGLKIVISKRNGKLYAKMVKNGKLITRNTSCGVASEFIEDRRAGVEQIEYGIDLFLLNPICESPESIKYIYFLKLGDEWDPGIKKRIIYFNINNCKMVSEKNFQIIVKKVDRLY